MCQTEYVALFMYVYIHNGMDSVKLNGRIPTPIKVMMMMIMMIMKMILMMIKIICIRN
jgi:hypothetical protein